MRRRWPTWIATTVLLYGATWSATFTAADSPPQVDRRPAATPIVPDDWKPLRDRWIAAVDELPIPALAACAVKDGNVVLLDAIGYRDPTTRSPVTVDSPFYIASSTKSFTAMAVAILVDEGKVRLDDPVKKYLPRFEVADRSLTESMTIRDLLAHRQGIDSGPIATCEAYTGLIDDDRYYRLLARVKPSPRFRYSNLNFTLAGRVIEAVSGQTWKEFIADRILEPSGMRHSYCQASSLYADPGAVLPMAYAGGKWSLTKTLKVDATMHAAGGIGASAADLARWLTLNLNAGSIDAHRVVSEQLAHEMRTRQIKVASSIEPANYFKDDSYGLGWFLGKYRDQDVVYHFGGYVGARCHISFIPDKGVGVAVLTNTSGPMAGFADVVAADA
jgi:CubicO group peptidase (beta-lactamase class C family)